MKYIIPFNKPHKTNEYIVNFKKYYESGMHCGNSPYSLKVQEWLVKNCNSKSAFLIKKNPVHAIQNFLKIKSFKKDQVAMNLGSMFFSRRKIADRFDIIIVESDIVWNFKNRFLGQDPVYFGKYLEGLKLISYAPSFGNVSIRDSGPEYVIHGLKSFSSISVRDTNSAEIVETIVGIKPNIVLDPTFLIDTKLFERDIGVSMKPYL